MMRSFTKFIVLVIPLFFIYSGCFDMPDGVVAPTWDISMNAPIMNKTFTLKEIIERDTSILKWYPVGSVNANQLYYADTKTVSAVSIGDKVKLENVSSTETNVAVGDINIASDPISTSVGFDFDPRIKPGTAMVYPAQDKLPITVDLPAQNKFTYFILNAGSINVTLKNNNPSPVALNIDSIYIINTNNLVDVGHYDGGSLSIPSGGSKTFTIRLYNGIKILNALTFACNVSSPGSGGQAVPIPTTALTVSGSFDLKVKEVQGNVTSNSITSTGSVQIDPQTKYQKVTIGTGNLNINLKNNVDVDVNAKVTLDNIYSSATATNPVVLNIFIPKKGTVTVPQTLNGYTIKSATATSTISYKVDASTVGTSSPVTVKSTDSFTYSVNVSQLSIKDFEGIVKPTILDVSPTTIKLDLKEMKDKFKFTKLNFKDPRVNIYLKPSSLFKMRFMGKITAKNSNAECLIDDAISSVDNPVDTVISIDPQKLAAFFNSFTGSFPDELYITGSAIVNPNYEQKVYKFSSTDNITGYAEIKFPLNVGIENGQFTDSTDYEKDIADSKKDAEKVQSVLVTLEITNGLAAKVKFSGYVKNAAGLKTLTLLPNRPAGSEYIEVAGAQVNSNGQVIAPTVTKETIELKGSDVTNFLNGKCIFSNVTLNTTGAGAGSAPPVEFKITDAIKVKAYGKLVYKVSEK